MRIHTDGNPARFDIGDRVFSHYVMDWGTITSIENYNNPTTHGVTGTPLPGSRWYKVEMDKGDREFLDDADANWDLARIVPPCIARRYGYGNDPKS